MKSAALLLFFALLACVSYGSLVWQFSTDGAVASKPLAFQGMLIVASDDGNVYALNPTSGARIWQAQVGQKPNEVIPFENSVVVSTTGGRVVRLDGLGKATWTVNLNTTPYNVSYIYGAAANSRGIFLTASNGLYLIERNTTARLLRHYPAGTLMTPPASADDYVIYGQGDSLYEAGYDGNVRWKSPLESGSFWARPAIQGNVVYAGALDGRMHAYSASNGGQLWEARTRNWVMSTPLVQGGRAYFGSNDGAVYAADTATGAIIWQAQTTLAVETTPEAGVMGGRSVIFAGGTDRSVYAINTDNGQIVWKGSAAGAAGSPLFYQNLVIFGSEDDRIYAYSSERACSITNPREGSVIGRKEVVVQGKYVSQAGGASVWVNFNGESWQRTNTSGDGWTYYANPAGAFKPGINVISCRVSDSSGEERGSSFTSVAVDYDQNMPTGTLVVTVSPLVTDNVPFTIYVNDKDDGSPVDRFTLTIAGKDIRGDKNATIKLPAGQYDATVKKTGFGDANVRINVSSAGVNPLYAGVGGVLILVLLWKAWASVKARKR